MTANNFNYTKQNGVLMKAKKRYTKQNGVVKKILSGWTKQNGVVEQVYTSVRPPQFMTVIPESDIVPEGESIFTIYYMDNQKIIYSYLWSESEPSYNSGVKLYVNNDYDDAVETQPVAEWGGNAWLYGEAFNYANGVSANQSIIQEAYGPHEISIGPNPGIISNPQYTEVGAMTIAKVTTDTFAGITYTQSASQNSSKLSIISPSGRERSGDLSQSVHNFYYQAGLGLYDGRGVAVGYAVNPGVTVYLYDFDNTASNTLENKVSVHYMLEYSVSNTYPSRSGCSTLMTFNGSDVYFSIDVGIYGSQSTANQCWLLKYNTATKTRAGGIMMGTHRKLIAAYNNYLYVLAAGSSATQTTMIIEKYDSSLNYVSSHNVPYDSSLGRLTRTRDVSNSPTCQMNNRYAAFLWGSEIILLDLDLF